MTPETGPKAFNEIAAGLKPGARTAYGQAVIHGTADSGDIFPEIDDEQLANDSDRSEDFEETKGE